MLSERRKKEGKDPIFHLPIPLSSRSANSSGFCGLSLTSGFAICFSLLELALFFVLYTPYLYSFLSMSNIQWNFKLMNMKKRLRVF